VTNVAVGTVAFLFILTIGACGRGPEAEPPTTQAALTDTAAVAPAPLADLPVNLTGAAGAADLSPAAAGAPGNAATPVPGSQATAAAPAPEATTPAPPPAAAPPAPPAAPPQPATAATPTPPLHAGVESGLVSVHAGVYTSAQAARGDAVMQRECLACHSPQEWGQLVAVWNGQTVLQLVNHIRQTMPLMAPGSLSMQEYTDIVARMLQLNSVPTGSRELSPEPDQLRNIRIERR
jgi:hypothetical protein